MTVGSFKKRSKKNGLRFGKTVDNTKRGMDTKIWKDAMPIFVDARCHIRSFDGNVYDVTDDIMEGSITRGIDAPMTLSITINNQSKKYAQQFIPDDQIVVWLRRGENEYQAFTGYIKRLPMGHIFTHQEITLEAECIIRRFKTKYWDAQMPESVIALSSSPTREYMISPDQTLAFLLTAPEYVGLDPKNVFIQRFPEIWIDRAEKISEQNVGCTQPWDALINCDDPCGAEGEDGTGDYVGGPISEYPGDNASKGEIACWMATNARARGLPGELPVMTSLVETELKNLSGGHGTSVGYFQLIDIHGSVEWRMKPENSLGWFLDGAEQHKGKYDSGNCDELGQWAQAVQASAFPGKYAQRCEEARNLISGCAEEEGGSENVFGIREGDVRPESSFPLKAPVGSGPGSGSREGLGTAYVMGVEKPAYIHSHYLDGKSSVQRPNKGIDVVAQPNKTIRAWSSGRVLVTGNNKAFNNYVIVEMHNTPILFTNLRQNSTRPTGTHFGSGDIIGRIGSKREIGTRNPFTHIQAFNSTQAAYDLDSSKTKNPMNIYNRNAKAPEERISSEEVINRNYRRFIDSPNPEEPITVASSPVIASCGCTEPHEDGISIDAAGSTPQGWHLVNNRKIRYKLDTSYPKVFRTAVERWESLGAIDFEEVESNPDVRVFDKSLDGPLGNADSSGTITFDPEKMDSATLNAREAAAVHEIGHILGFPHETNEPSVMHPDITVNRSDNHDNPTDYDVKLYREVWGGEGDPSSDTSKTSDSLDKMTEDGIAARCTSQEWGGGHDEETASGRPTEGNENWSENVEPLVRDIENNGGGTASTHKGHEGGEKHSADFWGKDGHGDPISKNTGDRLVEYAIRKYGFTSKDGEIRWIIWDGKRNNGSGWEDHTDETENSENNVHITFSQEAKASANVRAKFVRDKAIASRRKEGVDATGLFNRLRREQGLVPGEIGGLADWFEFLVDKHPFDENVIYPRGTVLINPGTENELGHMGMVIDNFGTVLDVNSHMRMVNTAFNIYDSNQGWAGYTHIGWMPDVYDSSKNRFLKAREELHTRELLGNPSNEIDPLVFQAADVRAAGFGQETRNWNDEVAGYVKQLEEKFPDLHFNTYTTHPPREEVSVDAWGPGNSRGNPINKSEGDAVHDFIREELSQNLTYTIWAGQIHGWGKTKPYSGFGGTHNDHVHMTWDGPSGGDGKGGAWDSQNGEGGGAGGSDVNGYEEPCIMKNPLGVYRLYTSLGDMAYSMALRRLSLGLDMEPEEEWEREKWELLGFPEEAYLQDMNAEIRDWSQIAELRKEPFIGAIQDVASSGLYTMQSLGTGEVVFWYPDILWGLEDWVLEDLYEEREEIQEEIPELQAEIARLEAKTAGHREKISELNKQIAKDERTIENTDFSGPASEGLIQQTINRNRENKRKLEEEQQKLEDTENLLDEKRNRLNEIDSEIRDREDVSGRRFDTDNVEILTKKMVLRDIELEDFHIYVSDEELVTHYYCAGDFQMEGSFSDSIPFLPCWRWSTIFTHPFFRKMADQGIDWNPRAFIQKYGSRPKKEIVNAIKTPGMAQIWADYEFLKQWLRCYTVELKTAFLPELYPGQTLEIESLGIQVQINNVTHSFGSNWETSVSCSMPLAVGDSPTDASIPPLPFWSLIPTSYLEEEDLQKYAPSSTDPYVTAPLGEGELYEALQEKRETDRQVVRDYLEYWRTVNSSEDRRGWEEAWREDDLGFVPRLDENGEWMTPDYGEE